MSARLRLENILAHRSLELEIAAGTPFLVTGKNETGKSSLAAALVALTAHDANPLGRDPAGMRTYITDGEQEGAASLNVAGEIVRWRPPAKNVEAAGGLAPFSQPGAVGMVDFIAGQSARGKKRLGLWETLFLPPDPRSILEPVWPQDDGSQLEAVLKTILRDGWDKAVIIYEEQRKEAKRRWHKITGQAWGSSKGNTWVPDGWRPQYEGRSKADFEADVTDARDRLQSLTNEVAVSAAEIANAQEARAKVPGVESQLKEKIAAYEAKGDVLREVNAEIEGLKPKRTDHQQKLNRCREIVHEKPPHVCPACGHALRIESEAVKLWNSSSPDEKKEAQIALGQHEAALQELDREEARLSARAKTLRDELRAMHEEGTQLRTELNTLNAQAVNADASPSTSAAARNISQAENDVEEAVNALTAWERWHNAKREHEAAVRLDTTVNLLGPTGARQKLIEKGLLSLNQMYSAMAGAAGWNSLDVTETGLIESNNRPVALTSESAKLKVQWISQFAWALLTKSRFVLLDRADALRDESWDGLVEMVSRLTAKYPHLYVVVCATSVAVPDDWDCIRLGE